MSLVLAWLAGCSCNEEPLVTDLAQPGDTALFQPKSPEELDGAYIDVALTATHQCGLRDNGLLVCWGAEPAPIFDNYRFVQIESSHNQMCGITEKLDVVCISAARGSTVTFVDSIGGTGTLRHFSAGVYLGEWCASTDERVVCDIVDFADLVEEVELFGTARGLSTACAWTVHGDTVCVEEDYYTKGKTTGTRPIKSLFDKTNVAYATLTPRRCVVDLDGEVKCLDAANTATKTKTKTDTDTDTELADPPPGPFERVWASEDHACAMRPDGQIECWGEEGEVPTTPNVAGFTEMSMVNGAACAVGPDQRIGCWGI